MSLLIGLAFLSVLGGIFALGWLLWSAFGWWCVLALGVLLVADAIGAAIQETW